MKSKSMSGKREGILLGYLSSEQVETIKQIKEQLKVYDADTLFLTLVTQAKTIFFHQKQPCPPLEEGMLEHFNRGSYYNVLLKTIIEEVEFRRTRSYSPRDTRYLPPDHVLSKFLKEYVKLPLPRKYCFSDKAWNLIRKYEEEWRPMAISAQALSFNNMRKVEKYSL